MPMIHKGLVKLMEECGEVTQAAAKLIAYPSGIHPDGGKELHHRLEEEIADVMAAADFVTSRLQLDPENIAARAKQKLRLFETWSREP